MTVLRFPISVSLVLLVAATALGQYGLYGSPDLVQLPPVENASPVSSAGHSVPTFQPAPESPHQTPRPGWPAARPGYPITRQPLLTPAAVRPQYAGPQYAAPQYARPQYAAPQYAGPQYSGPQYAVPTPAQPHPAVANYYTPKPAKPAQAPEQAVPVPPTPPGMAVPDPSPSDQYVMPEPHGCGTSAGGYLDYDAGWQQCGVAAQEFPGCGAAQGTAFQYGQLGTVFGAGCRQCPWYFGASALYLSRNNANRLWTSYQHGNFANQIMHTDMIGLEWKAGGEVKFGRRFGCCGDGPWALQATYFTIEPFRGYESVTHPHGVSSVLTVGNVFFHGAHATDWFDQAHQHQLWRRNELHNVEVSLVRTQTPWLCGSRFDCDVEFGVRYFRFWEQLIFGARAGAGRVDPAWAQRAFLEDKVSNNLVGFQFGANLGYHFHPSCRIYAAPKFGIYNNYIDHYFIARLSDGTVGTVTDPPGESFPARSNTNALSFLTQIDVGLDWQVTQRLSAQLGYRVMVATGMALADHQIPHFVNDVPEIRHIDRNGELILHGAFAGLTYNY